MEGASLEEVPYPKQNLAGIERFREEVARAHRERALLRFGSDVCGKHDDRQVRVRRDARLELLEDGEAVEVRHVQIEQHQIRMEAHEERQSLTCVLRAFHVREPRSLQQL